MADPTAKLPENVPGRYYVDTQCIDCDVCRDVAPETLADFLAGAARRGKDTRQAQAPRA